MTTKQLEANRANARKSTGPRTAAGREVSKMNAFKHGILSKEAVVKGLHARENEVEFKKLHRWFREDLQPVGAVEEMLVDQIVTAHWRLRRALMAESGEIALSVEGDLWCRDSGKLRKNIRQWENEMEPDLVMCDSTMGNHLMANQLRRVLASVEKEGEVTEAALAELSFRGQPYVMRKEFARLRLNLQQNPEGLAPEALRARHKQEAIALLQRELNIRSRLGSDCARREIAEDEARQAAAFLPSAETLEKIQRYETKLERQMFRAMAQLERLQRMRQGEVVPPPVSVSVA